MLPSAAFQPLPAPQRLLDTRPGLQTADGAYLGSGTQPARGTLQLRTAGRVNIPANASAVVLNVTAVAPGTNGFVTLHPRGSGLPTASNLNYKPGVVVANAVIARVGRDGDVCLFTSGSTDLVVDVAGWLTGPAPGTDGGQCPSLTPTDSNSRNQLVARPSLHQVTGTDRIAVLACDIPGQMTVTIDPVAVAKWANEEVAPWFVAESRGAYLPVFEAHPLQRITASSGMGCALRGGSSATGPPFTNVLVFDSTGYGGGMAGPGSISSDPRSDVSALSRPPNVSSRGGWIGGVPPCTTRRSSSMK